MQKWECRHFETCEAPLCPLDKVSLEHGIWYPDEGICKAKAYQSLEWIKNQKKIKKASDSNSSDTYYTVRMLNNHIIVRKGIKGLDPDKAVSKKDEQVWINARKIKKKTLSQEEKRKRLEALKKAREAKKKNRVRDSV